MQILAMHRGKELKVSSTRALRAAVLSAGQSASGGRRQGGDIWSCVVTLGTTQSKECRRSRRSWHCGNAKKEAKWLTPVALASVRPASLPRQRNVRQRMLVLAETTKNGTSMHLAEQRPNPSIKRTVKGLRPLTAAYVKR